MDGTVTGCPSAMLPMVLGRAATTLTPLSAAPAPICSRTHSHQLGAEPLLGFVVVGRIGLEDNQAPGESAFHGSPLDYTLLGQHPGEGGDLVAQLAVAVGTP